VKLGKRINVDVVRGCIIVGGIVRESTGSGTKRIVAMKDQVQLVSQLARISLIALASICTPKH